jgi:hypothetical protein
MNANRCEVAISIIARRAIVPSFYMVNEARARIIRADRFSEIYHTGRSFELPGGTAETALLGPRRRA